MRKRKRVGGGMTPGYNEYYKEPSRVLIEGHVPGAGTRSSTWAYNHKLHQAGCPVIAGPKAHFSGSRHITEYAFIPRTRHDPGASALVFCISCFSYIAVRYDSTAQTPLQHPADPVSIPNYRHSQLYQDKTSDQRARLYNGHKGAARPSASYEYTANRQLVFWYIQRPGETEQAPCHVNSLNRVFQYIILGAAYGDSRPLENKASSV
ncbi:hypothetical protein METBIDRAFT_112224 [Metschnikowia bicuspidata var. bicuspidata NRRL YB-4993]|uniref:Uncharacterized protein n=1 Tax=Metschnikowia bicuspidata var. bicuspidata NRRL YB-4993 TaxID=869754 RepID=A0A1A0HIB8_9ASCO|nr:hypothetical protein METBIDRAFT_112224 [Metschnikowia bicuspidata var. bicuspidata NRRL YB-4993]OBA23750.1 hypothetical protein METBIDRAFT_112224 [Metschnikowia bicuspidata var. bicuspidata NRRL YB-4993]